MTKRVVEPRPYRLDFGAAHAVPYVFLAPERCRVVSVSVWTEVGDGGLSEKKRAMSNLILEDGDRLFVSEDCETLMPVSRVGPARAVHLGESGKRG